MGYSLCMHIPSVQFLDWSTVPSQSFPPFLGVGALHSLLLQWVHSVPQVDHLLHSVHRPSTSTRQTRTDGGRADDIADGMRKTRIAQVGGRGCDPKTRGRETHVKVGRDTQTQSSSGASGVPPPLPTQSCNVPSLPGQRGLHASFWMP